MIHGCDGRQFAPVLQRASPASGQGRAGLSRLNGVQNPPGRCPADPAHRHPIETCPSPRDSRSIAAMRPSTRRLGTCVSGAQDVPADSTPEVTSHPRSRTWRVITAMWFYPLSSTPGRTDVSATTLDRPRRDARGGRLPVFAFDHPPKSPPPRTKTGPRLKRTPPTMNVAIGLARRPSSCSSKTAPHEIIELRRLDY